MRCNSLANPITAPYMLMACLLCLHSLPNTVMWQSGYCRWQGVSWMWHAQGKAVAHCKAAKGGKLKPLGALDRADKRDRLVL